MTGFPTSADIYLEMDGKKVAVVQSYTTRASKSSRNVEAFGESEPVATIAGQRKYVLELTRLYATEDAISDGINFYELSDFSLVICKPDRKVIYSGCEWSDLGTNCVRPPPAGCCICGGQAGTRRRTLWSALFYATPGYWRRAAFIRGSRYSGMGRPCWSR